ncbi:UNVERIFIED_CONTAM: hypothetical protein K2H54_004083 [Gekko kuhli]
MPSGIPSFQLKGGRRALPGPARSWRGRLKEPLECQDVVLQNALYTGDLPQVQRHFTERAEVNLVIQAKSHDLRWTSQKWGVQVKSIKNSFTIQIFLLSLT